MNNDILNNQKHLHKILKICVSGAAETGHCGVDALHIAKDLGREIAKSGAVLLTGASTGFPLWSAMGAKEVGGMVIGFSPASSETEHVEVYKLPIDYMDLIIYTGFGFTGRDLLLVRSSDAIVFGCGRMGTVHEFTIAFEEKKPMAILEGPWETDKELLDIVEKSHRKHDKIIQNKDIQKLIKDILDFSLKDKVDDTIKQK